MLINALYLILSINVEYFFRVLMCINVYSVNAHNAERSRTSVSDCVFNLSDALILNLSNYEQTAPSKGLQHFLFKAPPRIRRLVLRILTLSQ